jgi:dihydroorotate dehydrogenase (NAD+) catalytic subunit
MGGIATTNDALEFLIAGCRAVQVGTAVYADPDCPGRIAEGIGDYMDSAGMARLSDLIGNINLDREWLLGPMAVDEEGGK